MHGFLSVNSLWLSPFYNRKTGFHVVRICTFTWPDCNLIFQEINKTLSLFIPFRWDISLSNSSFYGHVRQKTHLLSIPRSLGREQLYNHPLSYAPRYGYPSGSFMVTLLAERTIFPARKTYFQRNVRICSRYSALFRRYILNIRNRLYANIIS